MSSPYIETSLTLDDRDLIYIENLIQLRIDELEDLKRTRWVIPSAHAEEQIFRYTATLAKIRKARENVKTIKAEADALYFARLVESQKEEK